MLSAKANHLRDRRRRGFSLLTMALFLPMLVAAAGLAVDLGRIYVAKSELQNFADTAALSAAFELDGTLAGLSDASTAAANGPGTSGTRNRWIFNSSSVPAPQVTFATSPNGTFSANPATAAGYRFVRVSVSGPVPIYFLRVVPGIPTSQNVTAVAVAGQGLDNFIGPGAAPFSPDAQVPTDPHFGYTIGQRYTLKWARPRLHRRRPGKRQFRTVRCHREQQLLCDPDLDRKRHRSCQRQQARRPGHGRTV
jgi:Flp pilus assembly protein TadG